MSGLITQQRMNTLKPTQPIYGLGVQMYTVKWTVIQQVQIPCPDSTSSIDPYTGRLSTYSCAALHLKEITTPMQKDFNTLEEAQAFINAAPEDIKPTMGIKEE